MLDEFNGGFDDYLQRKKAEFKLFNHDYNKTKINTIDEINHILNKKLKYQAQLKSEIIVSYYNYKNTNRNNEKIIKDGLECEYNYQRYDIRLQQKNFLDIFYDLDYKDYNYVFTNCGMSALFSVFYALQKFNYCIDCLSNIYVETERLLNDYLFNTKKEITNKALFIDSVSYKPLDVEISNNDLKDFDIFIVDTTLFVSEDVKCIIKALEIYEKPIILIKSHTKLDMLGIEWSNLGSICIINDNNTLNKLFNEIRIILSFIGGYAYYEDMPPYFSHYEYKNIVSERVKSIRSNVNYIYNMLNRKSNKYEIIKPAHCLFLLIKPKKFIDYKTLESDLRNYANNSKYGKLLCYADSFGLDCFGINGYYESMSADTEVIRLSPSDFPTEICDDLVNNFCEWLEHYL